MPKRFLPAPRLLAVCLVLIVMAALLSRYVVGFDPAQGWIPIDFEKYLTARDLVFSGNNPYELQTGPHAFKYSPALLALFDLLPHSHAKAWMVFASVSVCMLGGALLFGCGYLFWSELLGCFLGLILAWKGILETLDQGQVEFFLLFFCALALILLKRGPVVSGVLIGILPWIKLPWLFLALPFVMAAAHSSKKDLSRFLTGAIFACVGFGVALPNIHFGTEETFVLGKNWFLTLRAQSAELFLSPYNQGLMATLWRYFKIANVESASRLALGGSLILGGLFAGRLVSLLPRTGAPQFGWLSGWLILCQLVNPLGWRWGGVLLVGLPLGWNFGRIRQGSNLMLALLVLTLWLVQQNPVARALGFEHWNDLHTYGSVTAYWIALLMLTFGAGQCAKMDAGMSK